MGILQKIPDEDLQPLVDLYANHQSEAYHIFTLLSTCTAWKKKKPSTDVIQFFGINNDWLKTGTFVILAKVCS